MGSTHWWSGFAVYLLLTVCFPGFAAAQGNTIYNDAASMYGRYKRNNDQINALISRIRIAEEARRRLEGESRFIVYDDIVNINAAIDRDRRTIALLERRQAIIEHNWNRNSTLNTYYGELGETYRRNIYDPRTRKDVNLMGYRIDAFRNPGVRSTPPRVKSPPPQVRNDNRGPGRISDRGPGRTSKASSNSKNSNTPSRSISSGSSKKSSSQGGGSHTITLTPVK